MDEQLYMLGMGLTLDEKVEKAIANLRHYEAEALKRDPVNGYYVCDSYGKDSCVIRHLAKVAGVRHLCHHSLTTLDAGELIRFGRKHHPETVEHRHPSGMAMLTQLWKSPWQGPPTRLSRWCCEEYKEQGGKGMVKVFGIRASESNRRKANWKTWTPTRDKLSYVLNPILYWSDQDLWCYIKRERIPYCNLYDDGFMRLGCIGCPMGGTAQRVAQFARWPKYEQAWQRSFERLWNKYHGVPRNDGQPRWIDKHGFGSWRDMWTWWLYEPDEPDDDDCQMGLF